MGRNLLLLLLLALLVGVLHAQELTPAPEGELTIVNTDGPTVEVVPAVEASPTVSLALAGVVWVITGLLGVGAGATISVRGVGALADKLLQDRVGLAAVEGITASIPSDVAVKILTTTDGLARLLSELAQSAASINRLSAEVFDGVPAASKHPLPDEPNFSGATPAA